MEEKSFESLFYILEDTKESLSVDVKENLDLLTKINQDNSIQELFELLANKEDSFITYSHV